MNWLLEPLSHAFVLRGLSAGLLAALTCAVLSAFVVWRGMAFMGDALAHAVLPGIVVAYALGVSLFLGALGVAVLVVLGIGLSSNRGRLKEDTAIGVIFAGFFSLGILLLGRVATFRDLGHVLFGNILGVSTGDLIAMAAASILVTAVVAFTFKELVTASFDPAHSVAIGLSPELIRYLLLGLLALTTVVAMQTVGVLLVLALTVTPGAAASLLTRNLRRIVVLSLILAFTATVLGFYASYYADLPSGAAIVLTLTLFFIIAAGISFFRRRKNTRGEQKQEN